MTPGHPIRFRPTGLLAWLRERWLRFVAARAAARGRMLVIDEVAEVTAEQWDFLLRRSQERRGLVLPPPDPELRNPIGKDGMGWPTQGGSGLRPKPPATPVPGPGTRRHQ